MMCSFQQLLTTAVINQTEELMHTEELSGLITGDPTGARQQPYVPTKSEPCNNGLYNLRNSNNFLNNNQNQDWSGQQDKRQNNNSSVPYAAVVATLTTTVSHSETHPDEYHSLDEREATNAFRSDIIPPNPQSDPRAIDVSSRIPFLNNWRMKTQHWDTENVTSGSLESQAVLSPGIRSQSHYGGVPACSLSIESEGVQYRPDQQVDRCGASNRQHIARVSMSAGGAERRRVDVPPRSSPQLVMTSFPGVSSPVSSTTHAPSFLRARLQALNQQKLRQQGSELRMGSHSGEETKAGGQLRSENLEHSNAAEAGDPRNIYKGNHRCFSVRRQQSSQSLGPLPTTPATDSTSQTAIDEDGRKLTGEPTEGDESASSKPPLPPVSDIVNQRSRACHRRASPASARDDASSYTASNSTHGGAGAGTAHDSAGSPLLHPSTVTATKTKLGDVQTKIVKFEAQLHAESQQRRSVEEKRLQMLGEGMSGLEKTLNAEVRRRLEANKAIQVGFESQLATLEGHIERSLTEKGNELAAAVAALTARVTEAEGEVLAARRAEVQVADKLKADVDKVAQDLMTVKEQIESELKARKQRESAMFDKVSDMQKQIEGRLALERGVRQKEVENLKGSLEAINNNHVALDQSFEQQLTNAFRELRTALEAETEAREQSDSDIVQALNQYTVALQGALRIANAS